MSLFCLLDYFFFFFFFNDTATTEIYTRPYTLSLHDALPIYYRERWLRNFYTVQKRAISWNGAPYAFVVPPDQRDPVTAVEMLNILRFGEVEIEQAVGAFTADGVEYPKGSYVVRVAQPFGAFAKTMMEKQVYPDLREYPGGPPQRPYDVTAHTLPMQMGVKVITVDHPFQASLTKVENITGPAGIVDT